jgi:hypothetical protein
VQTWRVNVLLLRLYPRIQIPNRRVGVIIGKGWETINKGRVGVLQLQSGAKIQVTCDAIVIVEELINKVLAEVPFLSTHSFLFN